MIHCENCTGAARDACNAAFDQFITRTGEIAESSTVVQDPMAVLNSLSIAGRMFGGTAGAQDFESVREFLSDKDLHDITEVRSELDSSLNLLNCTLTPEQTATRGLFVMMQTLAAEAVVEKGLREERLEAQIEETSVLLDKARSSRDRIIDEIETKKAAARQAYIESQGWNPDELGFVENLDIRAHLRSLGFK